MRAFRIGLAVVASVLCIVAGIIAPPAPKPVTLEIHLTHVASDTAFQVFYDSGQGVNASSPLAYHAKAQSAHYGMRFTFPQHALCALRFDAGTNKGLVTLSRVTIRDGFLVRHYTNEALAAIFSSNAHEIESVVSSNGTLTIVSGGNDPYILFSDTFLSAVGKMGVGARAFQMLTFLPFLMLAICVALFVLFLPNLRTWMMRGKEGVRWRVLEVVLNVIIVSALFLATQIYWLYAHGVYTTAFIRIAGACGLGVLVGIGYTFVTRAFVLKRFDIDDAMRTSLSLSLHAFLLVVLLPLFHFVIARRVSYPLFALSFLFGCVAWIILFREVRKEGVLPPRKRQAQRKSIIPQRVKEALNRFGAGISVPHLISFDYRIVLTIGISLFICITCVLFSIHYSSISQLNGFMPYETKPHITDLVGRGRGIRSDEFAKGTPLLAHLAQNGFPVESATSGPGKTLLLRSLPAKHYSSLFQPQYYGFFLFNFARGLAFQFNYKLFGLFLSTFLVLLIVTRSSFLFSLLGSLWLVFTPFMQWWFSMNITEIVIASNMLIVFGLYLLFTRSWYAIALSALGVILYAVNFALVLYPPFQIPMMYFILFAFVGLVLREWDVKAFTHRAPLRVVFGLLVFVVFGVVLFAFYTEVRESIELISNTIYPGKRRVPSGRMGIVSFFSGFYDMFYTQGAFANRGNICEANKFFFTFPLVLVFIVKDAIKEKKIDPFFAVASLYLALLFIWSTIGLPEIITRITLLNRVPANRMIIGLGVMNIVVTVAYLTQVKKCSHVACFAVPLFVFALALLHGKLIRPHDAAFYSFAKIGVVVLLLTVLAFLFIQGRARTFLTILVLAVALPNIPVNPIAVGVAPIKEKSIVRMLTVLHDRDPNAKMIVYGGWVQANIIKAAGFEPLFGAYPDFATYKIFDPNEVYHDVYNRAATITFLPNTNANAFHVAIAESRSSLNVFLSPCHPALQKLGVKYFAFPRDMWRDEYRTCLTPVIAEPMNGYVVYTYR